jgi:deoxyribonuclease-4
VDGSEKAGGRPVGHSEVEPKNAMPQPHNHPYLNHLPFFLETPNELPGYAEEISLMRSLYTCDKVTRAM